MYLTKTNSELKTDAKAQLKGKWGMAILAFIIYNVVAGLPSAIPYVGFVISIIISGPLALGFSAFYLNVKRGGEAILESLFDGFKNFLPAFLTQLLIGIFTFLWTLLFIIPGIIKSISYSQAIFILYDNPEMRALDTITLSREMMDGYKGKYFLLQLSFIGWGILCLLTLGIGFLWLAPYVVTSSANFYDDVKNAYESRNYSYEAQEPSFHEND